MPTSSRTLPVNRELPAVVSPVILYCTLISWGIKT